VTNPRLTQEKGMRGAVVGDYALWNLSIDSCSSTTMYVSAVMSFAPPPDWKPPGARQYAGELLGVHVWRGAKNTRSLGVFARDASYEAWTELAVGDPWWITQAWTELAVGDPWWITQWTKE
jgi:hypothetical protein